MYSLVLNKSQKLILNKLGNLGDYYLAGGTAIALQLNHRRSIDFDFFSKKEVSLNEIERILKNCTIQSTLVSSIDEFTVVVDGVKITFLNYPYPITPMVDYEGFFLMPTLLTLAATKAFTIGRRPKWKDYVDLYFLLSKFTISEIITESRIIFGSKFNDKLFREQIAFYDDIDYSEVVDYIDAKPTRKEIKTLLSKTALV